MNSRLLQREEHSYVEYSVLPERSCDGEVMVHTHSHQVQQRHIQTGAVQRFNDDVRAPASNTLRITSGSGVDARVEDAVELEEEDTERDEGVGSGEAGEKAIVRVESVGRASQGDKRQTVKEDSTQRQRHRYHATWCQDVAMQTITDVRLKCIR